MRSAFLVPLALLAFQAAPAFTPYGDAKAILASHGRDVAETAWPGWAARHDAEIRGRLARGDEDSLVYFWLYGMSFTRTPRATEQELARLGASEKAEALLLRRLDHLVAGAAAPGSNERLQFARAVLVRNGIDPAMPAGKEQAKVFLVQARERVLAENARFLRAAEAANRAGGAEAAAATYSTLFRDRGLSSDTRLTAGFAIDRALAAITAANGMETGSVRRAAIIGPGLDFTDKAEGYDFYPPQTIQPFALLDSLVRLRLSARESVRLAAFDLSPRVVRHLETIAGRARGYALQLPLAAGDPKHDWLPELVAYWQGLGNSIGQQVPSLPLPPGLSGVRLRAIRVDRAVVQSIAPHDLDIIVQRLRLPDAERFDLIVATNILVYYDAFDQALALANIASMLRPGGYFLTNYAVAPSPQMEALPGLTTPVFFDKQRNGDTIYCYRRR